MKPLYKCNLHCNYLHVNTLIPFNDFLNYRTFVMMNNRLPKPIKEWNSIHIKNKRLKMACKSQKI